MKITPLLLLGWTIIVLGCSSSNKVIPTEPDWAADIDFFQTTFPQKHKDAFHQKSSEWFGQQLAALKMESDHLTDVAIAIRLQQIIAQMGDSHSGANYAQMLDRQGRFPFYVHWFDDGLLFSIPPNPTDLY